MNGRRIVLQSAEFHSFRLPSQELWRAVMEKLKAAGFNAVSLSFSWAYHSPAPGTYDFTGVRDVDRLLRTAHEAGLYVIARPGSYINAESTGGGFPAWLKTVPGRARSFEPGYREAYREWLHRINPIIARPQLPRGGPVILYNAENEYRVGTDAAYMQDIQDQARADGITVPITTNDCCDDSRWRSADHTTTTSPHPPKTLPVLYADDYGYHYGNVIGPQRAFSLPAGILTGHGTNTLALAVTAEQPVTGPGPLTLFAYGDVRGGP
ncbi:beta-galactosidase [Nonomuraea composti]|uniref:beta-galactosidase n=1 Tax=Nonomuraea composti TaxID=2720023 RepID=UPI00197F675D